MNGGARKHAAQIEVGQSWEKELSETGGYKEPAWEQGTPASSHSDKGGESIEPAKYTYAGITTKK